MRLSDDLKPYTLQQKVLLPLSAAWLLAMLLVASWVWRDFGLRLRDNLQQRADLIANAVNYASDTASTSGELQRFVASMGSEPDIESIVVVADTPPRIIASSQHQWQGKHLDELNADVQEKDLATDIRASSQHQQKVLTPDLKSSNYQITVPLLLAQQKFDDANVRRGVVIVHINAAAMRAAVLQHSLELALGMVLIATGIALLTGWLLQRHILLPVRAIMQTLQKHKAGETDMRVSVSPSVTKPDQLQKFARALNAMFDHIAAEENARLLIEGNLRRSNLMQQSILQSAGVAVIATDIYGVIQLFNPFAEKLLGYTAEHMVGWLSPVEFHDMDEVAAKAAALSAELDMNITPGFDVLVAKARKTGLPDTCEWTYIHQNGARIPVSLTVTCLQDDAGNITGYLGIAQDISDIKLAEARLHRVIEATSNGILMANQQGKILMVNSQTEKMFGYTRDELVGQSVDILVPDNIRHMHGGNRNAYMSAPASRSMGGSSLQAKRKDGTNFQAEIGLMPITGEDGLQVICTIADVTLHKARERELQEAKQMAEAAVRAKSEFLAVMSHEIRTPMNGVLGMAQLLAKTTLTAQQQAYLQIVQRSGEALITVINDILDFSKLEAGKVELEQRAFDLHAEVDAIVQLLSGRAEEKHLKLQQYMKSDCPRHVVGDSHRLRQVLVNLLSNAIKFTESGFVSVEIDGREQNGTAQLMISVRDSGKGIAQEKQQRLFRAFSQADSSTTREHGGTGLGLAISQQLVQAMGGHIQLSSTEGIGSRFWFELQLPVADDIDIAMLQRTQSTSSATQMRLHGTVLLAEDTEINRMVAQAMLEGAGLQVLHAESGAQALQILQQQRVDLVLMDCLMPEMDGYEATTRLRAQEKTSGQHLPVIALTANAMQEAREKCFAAGMDDFLSKPFVESDLLEKIAKYLPGTATENPAVTQAEPGAGNKALQALLQRLGAERVQQLITLFESNAQTILADLQQAGVAQDTTAMQRAAHSMKSAAAIFGLEALSKEAAKWETHYRDTQDTNAQEAWHALHGALQTELPTLCADYAALTQQSQSPIIIARSGKPAPAAVSNGIHGGNLLLVEDDPAQAAVIGDVLRSARYTVQHCLGASSAIAALEHTAFDLVITDIMLADGNGIDVVRAIRQGDEEMASATPVLAMSGFEDREQIVNLFHEGVDDFVEKPVIAEEFLSRVSNLVQKHKAVRLLREQNEKMESMAMHDQLTGLYNRHYLTRCAEQQVSRAHRQHSALSLIVMDIDHFKQVNDNFGHQKGDQVLQQVANVFDEQLRREDIAARYGGEEFVVLLHCGLEAAQRKANQLREVIDRLQPAGLGITASFGVSSLHDDDQEDDFDHLFQRADSAVYQAKSEGRNCVRMFP